MANLAQQILDEITARPEAFDMENWHYDGVAGNDGEPNPLFPDVAPACGTTLCVAGWAAHLTGWTVRGGTAVRGDEVSFVDAVAEAALELEEYESNYLFYASPGRAVERLRELASDNA